MGTMLQKKGLPAGKLPETVNLENPEMLLEIHKEYVAAGADIITTNTFGANALKYGSAENVEKIITAAVEIAKKSGAPYAALDIGPTGAMLEPFGTMTFDEAYELFAAQVRAGAKAGADLVLIETMSDLTEAKAALLAAKENCSLPVAVTMSFDESGRTFLGTTPEIAAVTLSSLGADAVGINCSLGPKEAMPLVERIISYSTVPVIVQPNAGLPRIENGETVYKINPEEFADYICRMTDIGAAIVGGCCGTTPEHISAVTKRLKGNDRKEISPVHKTAFTSRTQIVEINSRQTAIIGERINPTGKKKLKEAIKAENMDYIIGEALAQSEAGADVLDVNAGLPDIDEAYMLSKMIREIQSVTDLPLQIDSSDTRAVEAAARIYCGKPIINSVNGKAESLETVLPIAKKYGAAVVALTLDESGIPDSAEDRVKIAEKIMHKAAEYGIPKEDILVDCLVLTASTNQKTVMETLRAVSMVKSQLELKTVLGVSNVSFGLPQREIINSAFLAAAFGAGLNMPILNPLSSKYMEVVSAFKVLNNEDISAEKFIAACTENEQQPKATATAAVKSEYHYNITDIIVKGYKNMSEACVKDMLASGNAPLDIVNNYFIPALDIVGDKFDKGEMFLPQLMASAETVKIGFDVIKATMSEGDASKGKIILATVKGDIHDIGKNIVKMILQNYGYNIIDLGKDVEPEAVVAKILEEDVKLVGLSALMTTTVKSMGDTIALIRKHCPDTGVMVGGAVLNKEYAELVGADYYVKDAAESARVAEKFFS
ncbi:MAG: homocysteine S-methyltransferase family protein [Clostridia bacterium]|nr:homocysteine S-methyltransferase family protein [Clostridia bacterium]